MSEGAMKVATYKKKEQKQAPKKDAAPKKDQQQKRAPKKDAAPKKDKQQEPAGAKRREQPTPKYEKRNDQLRIEPKTWSKIMYLRDRGKTEISGFAVSDPEDPFHIVDFKLVKQRCVSIFTEFDDKGLANYLEDMVLAGYKPSQCMRIWIHTHPSMGASPSSHDEETFKRVNSTSTWGVMCIVSDDDSYARVVVNDPASGLSGDRELKVVLALGSTYEGVTDADYFAWESEYIDNVGYGQCQTNEAWWPSYCDDDDDENADRWIVLEIDKDVDLRGESVRSVNVESPDGFCYVYTDHYWLQYFAEDAELIDDIDGMIVAESAVEICDEEPRDWGALTWNGDEPILVLRDECVEEHYDGADGSTADSGPEYQAAGHSGARQAG